MRRFKLKSSGYAGLQAGDEYNGDDCPFMNDDLSVLSSAERSPYDWQEVFEEPLTFPVMMLVSRNGIDYLKNPHRVVYVEYDIKLTEPVKVIDLNGDHSNYKVAKEIPPIKKMTMKEVCEMAGCEVEIIKEEK